MSGHEVCRRIKATAATAATPVLHLSASFAESASRSQGLEMGADGYLVYPLEPRELLANVEALLRIRRAERAVRQERELLRLTLGSIGDAVVATNGRGKITFINPVAQELTGWDEPAALGKPLDDVFRIVSEQTGKSVESPIERVRSGRTAGLTNTVLVARDGMRRPIDDSAAPIRDEEGLFVGVVLVFRDTSQSAQPGTRITPPAPTILAERRDRAQGRVPRHARPRIAQSPGAHLQLHPASQAPFRRQSGV